MTTAAPELLEHWEAVLQAEGLGRLPDRVPLWSRNVRLSPDLVDIATEPATSIPTANVDVELRELFDALRYWLPDRDQEVLNLVLDGWKQSDIGEVYGIQQPACHYRVRSAMRRLSALGRAGTLPTGRLDLCLLVVEHWPRRVARPDVVAGYLARLSRCWSGQAASDAMGLQQSTTWTWGREARMTEVPELQPVRALSTVIARFPTSYKREASVQTDAKGGRVLPAIYARARSSKNEM